MTVRKAEPSELPQVARLLARAFYDDPAMSWVFPRDDRRLAQTERFWATRLRYLSPQDQVYVTDDVAAAGVWALPGQWEVSWRETAEMGRQMLTARLPMLLAGLLRLERSHPHEPDSFYLPVLGTDPARQGEGLGTALMQPGLDEIDAASLPAYLESSTPRSRALYERNGFEVTGELNLPRGGPPVWLMWRDPRAES
jgi:ribosomal protein S18 acetylase RimI-like enzyme